MSYLKINPKWIKSLNIKLEIIRFLEENIGNPLTDIILSRVFFFCLFFDMSPWTRETKAKVNKWDYINLKILCIVKEMINKMKRSATEWEKILASDISERGLISKIYKELIQLSIQKTT